MMSAIVLAGGKSARMGSDKAFLKLNGRTFVSILTDELMKVSDDIIVVIGKKMVRKFKEVLHPSIKIMRDDYYLGSPASGIATGLDHVKYPMTAIVACDLPLLKAKVINFLHSRAIGHSATVPIWPNGDIEPLYAVYNTAEAKQAHFRATLKFNVIGPRHIITEMKDVNYVSVSELRILDRNLESLTNINRRKDYTTLVLNQSSKKSEIACR